MKRLGIYFFLLLNIANKSSLTAFEITRQNIEPPIFYIGDHVTVELFLDLLATENLGPPSSLSQLNTDVEITGIGQSQNTVKISFIPLKVGLIKFPPIELGDVRILNLSLETSSILDSENYNESITQLLGPVAIPWMDLSIALIIQIVFLLPILLYRLYKKIPEKFRQLQQRIRLKRPYQQLKKQLEQLSQDEVDELEFYRIISRELRIYLDSRSPYNCSSYTGSELSKLPAPYALIDDWQSIIEILKESDRVRFAHNESNLDKRAQILRSLKKIAKSWEYSSSLV